MLDLLKLTRLFDRLDISPSGRELVENARKLAPVRKVQSHYLGNVITLFFSKKMQKRLLATEARTTELPLVQKFERDEHVIEFYLQPFWIDLILVTEKGQKTRNQYCPDTLAIRDDSIVVIETKTESELKTLSKKQPHRYQKDKDGIWRSPQVEAIFAEMGLSFQIVSSREFPQYYIENIEFLKDYWDENCPPTKIETNELLWRLLEDTPAISIWELIHGEHKIEADEIFKAIADGIIVTDLYEERLSTSRRAFVYRDYAVMEYYKVCRENAPIDKHPRWDFQPVAGDVVTIDEIEYTINGFEDENCVLMSGDDVIELSVKNLEHLFYSGSLVVNNVSAEPGKIIGLFPEIKEVSRKRLLIGLQRKQDLENGGVKPRTKRRWINRVKSASHCGVSDVIALVPKTNERGNRNPKLPPRVYEIIEENYKEHYDTPDNKNINFCYIQFKNKCNVEKIRRCSRKTFYKHMNKLINKLGVNKRCGRRIIYQRCTLFVMWLEYRTSVHGIRPFEVVHIDHTLLDIELISVDDARNLGKAWLTLAMCAFSRRIVGFYLTYEHPSYKSCMMVIRDIVRRFGRMPTTFVVDNGPEFKSTDFILLAEFYGCNIRYRPKIEPRAGSVEERMFGTTNTEFIHNLAGNTQLMKQVRLVVKSVNPKNLAEWTLEWLYHAFDYWSSVVYAREPHPALNQKSPLMQFEEGTRETGARSHKAVKFDRNFKIITSPLVAGDTRIVDAQRGVKVDYTYYQTELFMLYAMGGEKVEVKDELWEPGIAYTWVKKRQEWVTCFSKYYGMFKNFTCTERRVARDELKRQQQLRKEEMSPERLSEWVAVFDINNFKDNDSARIREVARLYSNINMTAAEEVETTSDTGDLFFDSNRLVSDRKPVDYKGKKGPYYELLK